MLNEPPPDDLDLLVVGGITIDSLADGMPESGGSVIHVTRAAAPRGVRVGVMTAAGQEPIAIAGVDELLRLASWAAVTPHSVTTMFRHHETARGREMWLERAGGQVEQPGAVMARAVLLAPVWNEVPLPSSTVAGLPFARGAILQGWLRRAESDGRVIPVPLSALAPDLVSALAGLELLVASREDLRAEADDPIDQLRAMREAFGDGPTLVVTDGMAGLSLDDGVTVRVRVPVEVRGAPTVGAGDILAAFMLLAMATPDANAATAATDAMEIVSQVLRERAAD